MLYHFNGTFCVRAGYLKGENNILWDRYIIDIALSDAMSQPIV